MFARSSCAGDGAAGGQRRGVRAGQVAARRGRRQRRLRHHGCAGGRRAAREGGQCPVTDFAAAHALQMMSAAQQQGVCMCVPRQWTTDTPAVDLLANMQRCCAAGGGECVDRARQPQRAAGQGDERAGAAGGGGGALLRRRPVAGLPPRQPAGAHAAGGCAAVPGAKRAVVRHSDSRPPCGTATEHAIGCPLDPHASCKSSASGQEQRIRAMG